MFLIMIALARHLKIILVSTGSIQLAGNYSCWLRKLWKHPSCGEACGPGRVLTPSFLCCMCFRGCLLPCFHRPVSLLSLLSRPHRSALLFYSTHYPHLCFSTWTSPPSFVWFLFKLCFLILPLSFLVPVVWFWINDLQLICWPARLLRLGPASAFSETNCCGV